MDEARTQGGRIDMGALEAQVHIQGDMDFDGDLDFDDIEGFVLALLDAGAYEARYGVPPSVNGDTDGDGDFDFDDILGIVVLLGGEPTSATSTTVGPTDLFPMVSVPPAPRESETTTFSARRLR